MRCFEKNKLTTLSNDAGELPSAAGFGDIEAVYAHLHKLEHEIRQISNPEELAALEQEIRRGTEALAGFVLQKQLQANLDGAEQREREAELIKGMRGKWRKVMKRCACIPPVGLR